MHTITIQIDEHQLTTLEDSALAAFWHVAQWNPAPHGDRDAGSLAEAIGREIVRRWLAAAPVALWHHQGSHYGMKVLREHGHWPGPNHDVWVHGPSKTERKAGS